MIFIFYFFNSSKLKVQSKRLILALMYISYELILFTKYIFGLKFIYLMFVMEVIVEFILRKSNYNCRIGKITGIDFFNKN